MFVCLGFFLFSFLIVVFLHQNLHLESDNANFKPCLSIPLLTSLSELQSARSIHWVSLGSAEKAKAQAEASIGAGDRRKQRRLHFKFIWSRGWEICPVSRDTEIFHTREAQPCSSALLVCRDMGTILSGYFVPSTILVSLQLLQTWRSYGSTLIILKFYDFTPNSSATLLGKAQELIKA